MGIGQCIGQDRIRVLSEEPDSIWVAYLGQNPIKYLPEGQGMYDLWLWFGGECYGLVCITLFLDHPDCVGFLHYVGDLKELLSGSVMPIR